jgi:hypothetical protein
MGDCFVVYVIYLLIIDQRSSSGDELHHCSVLGIWLLGNDTDNGLAIPMSLELRKLK